MKKIGLIVLVILIFFTGIGYLLLNSSQMQEYDKYLEIRNQDIEILNSNSSFTICAATLFEAVSK